MKYLIYKVTNKVNCKTYIGAHKTKNVNDGYMGSGVILKKAIKKYGLNNFKKEILFEVSSEEEMYTLEKELITKEIVNDKNNYNVTLGGVGGFSHIDHSGDKNPMKDPKNSQKVAKKLKKIKNGKDHLRYREIAIQNLSIAHKNQIGRPRSEETKRKISKANTGKIKSDETKRKISDATKGRKDNNETKLKKSLSHKKRIKENNIDMGILSRGLKRKKIKCPHCGKECAANVAYRWHFDNCKKRID